MGSFKEHDGVVLGVDLPAHGLKKGMIGTIVHVFTEPKLAYEVEFSDNTGRTVVQLPLLPDQIVPCKP
jgi:hypothetical protein